MSLVFFSCEDDADKNFSARTKLALREAGNQLLLKNKDSTSLILPVLALRSSVYQLEFKKTLSFEPNDLVTLIDSSFNVTALPKNYRVEVLQCADNEVAYSYEKHALKERTIIPCSGRFLPDACYIVKVAFLDKNKESKSILWLLYSSGFVLFLIILNYLFKRSKPKTDTRKEDNAFKTLGVFQFYPEQNKLVKAATEISLSKKECELLALFVAKPNQIIKRDELTKKVWEDHGVFVGRSLDTYISKLRKKLQDDTSIKLTNVHGVGYKLEVL